ncbi:hypothetical protein D3C76_1018240 [compost metagenome]
MEGQGERQEDEQGVTEVGTIAKAVLPDGVSGEPQQDDCHECLGGQVPVGEREDITGRK